MHPEEDLKGEGDENHECGKGQSDRRGAPGSSNADYRMHRREESLGSAILLERDLIENEPA